MVSASMTHAQAVCGMFCAQMNILFTDGEAGQLLDGLRAHMKGCQSCTRAYNEAKEESERPADLDVVKGGLPWISTGPPRRGTAS